ncbi:MAG: alpha/beta hydrolase [Deltaproteobacteria bacterium]|nr:alpha/beta hydrolase [Deltaproteobacteria bacterium]
MIDFLEIGGVKIAYRVNDDGLSDTRKSLVFIHGSGCDHTLWDYQFKALSGDFNIVGVDLPGHGRSEGAGEQDVERYVEWVRKIIEALALRKPVLAGHSLGAAISLTFAVKYGERLSGIVPVGGGVTMPVNEMILDGIRNDTATTLTFIAKFSVTKKNREKFVKPLGDGMLKVSPEIIYGDFLSCNRLDITEEIQKIPVPTLLICGEDDKMTPPDLSRYMSENIPGAKLAVIGDAGHFVMQENADAFNGVLKNFIQLIHR